MAESVDNWAERKRREEKRMLKRGWWDRLIHYGPEQSFLAEIPPQTLKPGDFVRIEGAWLKIRKIDDQELVTETGKHLRLASPGEDFRYRLPDNGVGVFFLNFWLGIIAIAISVCVGLCHH